jgi:hypothetical protein
MSLLVTLERLILLQILVKLLIFVQLRLWIEVLTFPGLPQCLTQTR